MPIGLILFLINPLAGLLDEPDWKRAQVSGVELAAGAVPDTVVLTFHPEDQPGWVTIPIPEAARDWSAYRTFTFSFQSSSTIRWELILRNRAGQSTAYRVQPYQDVSVRAALPISFLTREYLNNRQFTAYWLSNWGGHIDLRDVESLTIRMHPNRDVRLKLGPFTLEKEAAPDRVYLDRPVVDEFGQWIGLDWPGKVTSAAQLQAAWEAEDRALARTRPLEFSRYGGWGEGRQKPTGFFRTIERGGRWWLVDPEGHLFFSAGMDCVRYRDPTRAAGRQMLFAKLPRGSRDTADFYCANVALRHGSPGFVAGWKAKVVERLRAWGFNTVGNWSDPALHRQPAMPFVTNVRIGHGKRDWHGYPDVYSRDFLASAAEDAQRLCGPLRDEKLLIGYFIGNEPRWHHRNLIQTILDDEEDTATSAFVESFLLEKGDTGQTREALLEELAAQYFRVVTQAIRKADPNHLVLGIRWAGGAPDAVLRANRVFDVFSINIYRFAPPPEQIERIYRLVERPVIIGEFHFGAAERGYAPSLVMVKDQAERAAAYQYYVEQAAALPWVVGTHYFQFADQPVTGRFDGENYNLGFVSQQDLPYSELAEAARTAHGRMYRIHAGRLAPTRRQARVR